MTVQGSHITPPPGPTSSPVAAQPPPGNTNASKERAIDWTSPRLRSRPMSTTDARTRLPETAGRRPGTATVRLHPHQPPLAPRPPRPTPRPRTALVRGQRQSPRQSPSSPWRSSRWPYQSAITRAALAGAVSSSQTKPGPPHVGPPHLGPPHQRPPHLGAPHLGAPPSSMEDDGSCEAASAPVRLFRIPFGRTDDADDDRLLAYAPTTILTPILTLPPRFSTGTFGDTPGGTCGVGLRVADGGDDHHRPRTALLHGHLHGHLHAPLQPPPQPPSAARPALLNKAGVERLFFGSSVYTHTCMHTSACIHTYICIHAYRRAWRGSSLGPACSHRPERSELT